MWCIVNVIQTNIVIENGIVDNELLIITPHRNCSRRIVNNKKGIEREKVYKGKGREREEEIK